MESIKDEIFTILASKSEYTWDYLYVTPAGIDAVLTYMQNLPILWNYSIESHPDELGSTLALSWLNAEGDLDILMLSERRSIS